MDITKYVAGILLVLGFIYLIYDTGRSSGRVAVLEQSVEAVKKSDKIKNEVEHMSPYDICRGLGGMHDRCSPLLRGVD